MDIGSFCNRTRNGFRARGLGSGPSAIVVTTFLLLPTVASAAGSLVDDPDFVDNKFEAYMLAPCLASRFELIVVRGWTFQEVDDYSDDICSVVFSGSFNSETYASTTNVGTVAAQSKTADLLAAKQIDSVQDRLDEIKEEEEPSGGIGLLLSLNATWQRSGSTM